MSGERLHLVARCSACHAVYTAEQFAKLHPPEGGRVRDTENTHEVRICGCMNPGTSIVAWVCPDCSGLLGSDPPRYNFDRRWCRGCAELEAKLEAHEAGLGLDRTWARPLPTDD